MRKALLLVAFTTSLSGVAYVTADVAAPDKGMIVGTAVEISTYAIQGMTDKDIPAMASRCEQGFPVGIVDDASGEVWVVIYRSNAPASGLQTGNKQLQPFMGKKVAAQGLKYKAKGVNVMRVAVISEY